MQFGHKERTNDEWIIKQMVEGRVNRLNERQDQGSCAQILRHFLKKGRKGNI